LHVSSRAPCGRWERGATLGPMVASSLTPMLTVRNAAKAVEFYRFMAWNRWRALPEAIAAP